MKYKKIPYVGKRVSKIIYGTAELNECSDEKMLLLDGLCEQGINTFDTARVYCDGNSEEVLGQWMQKRNNRKNVVIITKCGHPDMRTGRKRINISEMKRDLERSFERLKTNHIDIYMLHRDDTEVPVGEIVEIFNDMYRKGQIGAFGGSNRSFERIKEANDYAKSHDLIPFTVSSPSYSIAVQTTDLWGGGSLSISGEEGKCDREWYEKEEMPVIAYSSLGRGFFSGKIKSDNPEEIKSVMDEKTVKSYGIERNFEKLKRAEELAKEKGCTVSQIAIAWLMNQKLNTFAVVSSDKLERIVEDIGGLAVKLTKKEMKYLNLEI